MNINYLKVMILFVCSSTICCNTNLIRDDNASSIERVTIKKAVLLYTYTEYSPYFPPIHKKQPQKSYCLKDVHILTGGRKIAFHDNYEINYFVKSTLDAKSRLYMYLENNLLSDDYFFPPMDNSPKRKENIVPNRRVGDTPFKFNWGNINHKITITSNEIYQGNNDSLDIYLAFNIAGDFFYYKDFDSFVIKNVNSISLERLCPFAINLLHDDFLIVDKIDKLSSLTETEIDKLNLIKSEIDTIRIPIGE